MKNLILLSYVYAAISVVLISPVTQAAVFEYTVSVPFERASVIPETVFSSGGYRTYRLTIDGGFSIPKIDSTKFRLDEVDLFMSGSSAGAATTDYTPGPWVEGGGFLQLNLFGNNIVNSGSNTLGPVQGSIAFASKAESVQFDLSTHPIGVPDLQYDPTNNEDSHYFAAGQSRAAMVGRKGNGGATFPEQQFLFLTEPSLSIRYRGEIISSDGVLPADLPVSEPEYFTLGDDAPADIQSLLSDPNISSTFDGLVVPEPTSLVLLALGGSGLLFRRRAT